MARILILGAIVALVALFYSHNPVTAGSPPGLIGPTGAVGASGELEYLHR